MVARVVELVAGHFDVTPSEVLASRARRRDVALARQASMHLAAVDLELSHDAVGGWTIAPVPVIDSRMPPT